MSENIKLTNEHIEQIKNTIRNSFLYVKFKGYLGLNFERSLFDDDVILNILSHPSLSVFEDQFEQTVIGEISITQTSPKPNDNHSIILKIHLNDDFKQTFNMKNWLVILKLSENESFYNDVEIIIKEISDIFDKINSKIQLVLDEYQKDHPKKESKYSVATVKNVAKMFGFE